MRLPDDCGMMGAHFFAEAAAGPETGRRYSGIRRGDVFRRKRVAWEAEHELLRRRQAIRSNLFGGYGNHLADLVSASFPKEFRDASFADFPDVKAGCRAERAEQSAERTELLFRDRFHAVHSFQAAYKCQIAIAENVSAAEEEYHRHFGRPRSYPSDVCQSAESVFIVHF